MKFNILFFKIFLLFFVTIGFTACSNPLGTASNVQTGFLASNQTKPVSSTLSTLSASLSSVLADGSTTSIITATLNDNSGNPVAGKTVALNSNRGLSDSIVLTSGVSNTSGVATFTVKSTLSGVATFTATDVTDAVVLSQTAVVSFTAGPATQLAFTVQASNTTAGSVISPSVQVSAEDINGNVDTTYTGNISIAIGTNPSSGVLSGTLTVAAVSGVASFSNLTINKSGSGYTLAATAAGKTSAASSTFNIISGLATQLIITSQPTNAYSGISISPAVQVSAEDALGNVDTTFSGNISVALGTNLNNGTLSGTLAVPAVNGVVNFSNLSIDKPAYGYTLVVSASGVSSATTSMFAITSGAANSPFIAQEGVPAGAFTSTAYATALDGNGNSYVVGATTGNLVSGSGASVGNSDLFFAKYNSAGSQLWIKEVGVAGGWVRSTGVAVDTNGNSCIVGADDGTPIAAGFTTSGGYDFFISRYDSSGTLQWTKQIASNATSPMTTGGTASITVAMDTNGNCYATGTTRNNVVTGSGSSVGFTDIFAVKFDSTGAQQWIQEIGEATTNSLAYQANLDNLGNLYITGKTQGNLVTGSGTSTGSYDLVVIKLSATNGSTTWIKQFGVSGYYAYGLGSVVDLYGNIYISGITSGNLVTGSGSATGNTDAYLIKMSSSGSTTWIKQFGVSGYFSYGRGVTIDAFGNPTLVGYTTGNLVSGSGSATGNTDMYILKLDSIGNQKLIQQIGVSGGTLSLGTNATADTYGNIYVSAYTSANLVTLSGSSTGNYDIVLLSCNASGTCR